MDFVNPFPQALWRRRKLSRSMWRAGHAGKKHVPHGGRGKKYGLKSKKAKRRSIR